MRRIVITGMGIISPVGNSVPVFWDNLKAGVCGVDLIRSFDTSDLSVKVAAQVKDFNPSDHGIDVPTARKADLYTQYAMAAAHQAMKESNPEIDPERLGVYVGSGIGGIHTFIAECKNTLKTEQTAFPAVYPDYDIQYCSRKYRYCLQCPWSPPAGSDRLCHVNPCHRRSIPLSATGMPTASLPGF